MENLSTLRKECKKLMIELELDRPGSLPFLADQISIPKDQVNSNSLTMAITGYRNGARSSDLLRRLYIYLTKRFMTS